MTELPFIFPKRPRADLKHSVGLMTPSQTTDFFYQAAKQTWVEAYAEMPYTHTSDEGSIDIPDAEDNAWLCELTKVIDLSF